MARMVLGLSTFMQGCMEGVASRRRGNTSDAALLHGFHMEVAKVARWTSAHTGSSLQVGTVRVLTCTLGDARG